MKILVLGSGAAVSPDARQWVLLNASPDLGHHLRSNPALHPCAVPRDTPIRAVVLLDAQIDHVAGLLSLREGPPLDVYCTPSVFEELTTSLPILPVLQHYCGVRWHLLPVAGEQTTAEFRVDALPSLSLRAIAIPGKTLPHSPRRNDPSVGDNIALLIEDTASGKSVFYAPVLASVGGPEMLWLEEASCVVVDGSFCSEDETIKSRPGAKAAGEMGHLAQTSRSARPGMIAVLDRIGVRRKVLIHLDNGNPILDEPGAQRLRLADHGIEVAYDGMEIEL